LILLSATIRIERGKERRNRMSRKNRDYTDEELLEKFGIERSQIRPAVEAMLAEAKAIARGEAEYGTMEDVFGSEESAEASQTD
jgi:ligand-binding sensor protein